MNTRTYTRLFLLLFLFPVSKRSFAQKGWDFGLRYIVQKTWLVNGSEKSGSSQLKRESTWSYLNGGVAVGYQFNKMMGVEVNILDSRQGQEYSGTTPVSAGNTNTYARNVVIQEIANGVSLTGDYQAKAELNCTKIPILFRWTTDITPSFNIHALAGPQLNIIRNVVYELNHEDIELPGYSLKPKDAYKGVTIDAVISAGAGYYFGRHLAVSADLRFDYGLQDVEEKSIKYSYRNLGSFQYYGDGRPATHNMTLGLMIGLNYRM